MSSLALRLIRYRGNLRNCAVRRTVTFLYQMSPIPAVLMQRASSSVIIRYVAVIADLFIATYHSNFASAASFAQRWRAQPNVVVNLSPVCLNMHLSRGCSACLPAVSYIADSHSYSCLSHFLYFLRGGDNVLKRGTKQALKR